MTDHGYLPVWLLLAGQIDRAIAADLREGPLKRHLYRKAASRSMPFSMFSMDVE